MSHNNTKMNKIYNELSTFYETSTVLSLLYVSTNEIFVMTEKKSIMQTLNWQPGKNHITASYYGTRWQVCFIYLTFI